MAEAFTNTTDASGLTYPTFHIQNRTNTQDPSNYKYAPGADLDIYNTVRHPLSSFVSFLVNTLNMIYKYIERVYNYLKKNIGKFFKKLYNYTIYFIILMIVCKILKKQIDNYYK